MAVLYSNNASSTLSASITSTATSLSVASGAGALFPAPSGSDYFYITLVNSAGAMEIMKVTARSADTLTVVRGQDGTTGVAWAAGDRVELRFTKAMLDDFKTDTRAGYLPLSGGTLTGTLNVNANDGLKATYGGTDGDTWYRGWGMESNRTTVYIRPTTNGVQSLRIGYSENTQNWIGVRVDANTFTHNGYNVLNANNYTNYAAAASHTHSYLPLSGGDLTGNITIGGFLKIATDNSDWATGNYFRGAGNHFVLGVQSGGTLYLNYGNEAGTTRISGTTLVNDNQVLHAGNFSSYALPNPGSGTGGRVLVNLSGNPSWSDASFTYDPIMGQFRATNFRANVGDAAPTWNFNAILHAGNYTGFSGHLRAGGGNDGMDFNTLAYNTMYYAYISDSLNRPGNRGYSYGTILTFDPGQGTGGRAQFYVSHAGNDLIFRGGWNGNDSWQTWNRVLTDQNYTSYTGQYVLKSGDTMSGALTIAAPIGDGTASLILSPSSSSGTFQWASKTLAGGLASGQNVIHLIGKAASANNSGYIGYKHSSDGSSSNFMTIGLYGSDNLLNIYGNGNVNVNSKLGIACTPDIRLSVNGEAHISSYLYMGGTAGSYSSWGSRDYTTSGNRYINANYFEVNNYGYGSTWSLAVDGSSARYNGNVILHAGNYTSYAASASHTHTLLTAVGLYSWDASTTPASYSQGIQSSFVSSSQGFQNYGSVLTMNTYSGGGGALQIYVPYSPTYGGSSLQIRQGNYDVNSGNSWTSWKTLLDSSNYTNYGDGRYVLKTGDTMTGTLKINTAGSTSSTSHVIIKRSGAAEPSSFGSYSGLWRSSLEIWNNNSTKMLFMNSGETDFDYAHIKSVNSGLVLDVGSNGGVRAFAIGTDGTVKFDQGESINLYGARGRYANQYMHLYSKVGVGHPSGWGQGETNTPSEGLSTYGGINIAYGTNAASTFSGRTQFNRNGRSTSYVDSNIEVYTGDNTPPSIAFHRGGYSATSLYESDGELFVNAWVTRSQNGKLISSGNISSYAAPASHDHSRIGWVGTRTAESGTTNSTPSGYMEMVGAYNNGWPNQYGNVLSMNGGGASQLYMGWFGGSGAETGELYYRSMTDWRTNWGSWRRVLTNANWSEYAAPISHTHNYVLRTGDTMTGRLTIDGSGWTTNNRNYSNEWIEFPNYSGLYSPNNGAHFYPNSGTYGSWLVSGSRNGWSGLEFQASNGNVQLMIDPNSNTSGFHNNSYGWQFRWNNGTAYIYKNAYGGGTGATVLDSSNYTNYLVPVSGGDFSGRIRITNTNVPRIINQTIDGRGVWDGSLNGYLLLAKAYVSGIQSNSEVTGRIFLSRGSTGEGRRTETIEVFSKSAYNSENFVVNWPGGRDFSAGTLHKVTYNGTVYHALRLGQYGGGAYQAFAFDGWSTNAGLNVVYDSEVSNVTSFGNTGLSIGLDGSVSTSGYQVLHAGNYTSYGDGRYLRGDGTTPVTPNNLNFGIGRYFGYTYIQTFSSESLHLNPTGNAVYINGNVAIHAGNISSYAGADTGAKGNIQIFNASGTFTVPAGITKLRITAFGGGGGGASAYGWAGGSGGAGIAIVTVTPGTSYTVTIGAGGRGAGWTGGSLAGGTTSFGSLVTATGGLGSVWNTVSPTMGSFTTTGTLIASIKATAGNLSLWGGADGATSYSFVGAGGGGMHGGGGSAGTAGGNSIYGAKGNNGGSSPTTSNGGAGGSVSGGAAGGAGGVYGTDGYGVAYGAGGGGAGGMIIEW